MNELQELLDAQLGVPAAADVREAAAATLRSLRHDRRLEVLDLAAARTLTHRLFHMPDLRTLERSTGEYRKAEFERDLQEAVAYTHRMLIEVVDGNTLRDTLAQRMQETLGARGGLMRVVDDVPFRMNVYERWLALLPRDFDDNRAGAVPVREPGLIRALTGVHARLWRSGDGWDGRRRVVGNSLVDLIDVLGELLSGSTDEAAAQHLGLSLRTYRRRVRELLDLMGTASRFRAGAIAQERGYIDLVRPEIRPVAATPTPYLEALSQVRSVAG